MRPIRVTVGSQTTSATIPLDTYQDPFNVGLAVVLSSGASLTYTVQHTFDDVFAKDYVPENATWFSHASLVSKTASSDGNYAYPVTATRLNITLWVSGTATMTVVQTGMPGR
jgi:hypothetical protein